MLLLLTLACDSDTTLHTIEDVNAGDDTTISGRVCSPWTYTWLEGATVYTHLFDVDNNLYDTVTAITDESGYYALTSLPTGRTYTIYIQMGNEMVDMFEAELPVAGGLSLKDPECGGGGGGVVVISGAYDEFDKVLPAVGIAAYDTVNGETGSDLVDFLSDPMNLVDYEKVFFTGGHTEEDVFYDTDGNGDAAAIQAVHDTLRSYVQGGGEIYATDWSYDVIESVWPNHIDYLGDDVEPDVAQRGETGGVTAHVTDKDMGDVVGSEVTVVYDLIEWPLIESVSGDVTIHMTGTAQWRDGFEIYDVPASPLLVSFTDGDGLVVVSTFRFTTQAKRDDGLPFIDYIINDI
ncbi:MAG: carboxypeptidase-like regulatory domain-containing protein [Proteobacteria bacterium]|nr:carboxypeptidase-like regulatory domain-containing protein [Pseudomonadota bacterium]MCP4920236.1 carboxypeptidase-like regulatory domain-containing protein [Pseudomonadota bacterium]